jgi:hypothetical protein
MDKVADLAEFVADCTDRNDNNNAIHAIAEFFGMKNYAKIFEYIMAIHKIEGGMPPQLIDYRTELTDTILLYIKRHESEEVYELLHASL